MNGSSNSSKPTDQTGRLALPTTTDAFGNVWEQGELTCPHGRPVYLGPCAFCELEAVNRA